MFHYKTKAGCLLSAIILLVSFISNITNPVANAHVGSYYELTGSNYAQLPDSAELHLTKFSVATWFQTSDSYSSSAFIVNKGGSGSEASGKNMNYGIWMTGSERIQAGFETKSGRDYHVTSSKRYNDGNWHYAVVTYSGSSLRLYVDGVRQASISTSGAIPDTLGTQPFRIGANSLAENGFFRGNVDEVRIWNRALTSSEVSDAFNNNVFSTNGQIVYLSFDKEICGDKIDNDKDGLVDEGCTQPTQEPAGVIVPLYIYPTSTQWDRLIDVKNAHPAVPLIAIVNPNSGAGSTQNSDYVAGINDLRNSGIKVLGYTYTSYGSRSIAEVKSEIDKYVSWYNVNGMLFDEMSNEPGKENYYRELTNYAYSRGLTFTAGNPGADTLESYIGTVNTITISSGSVLPSIDYLSGGWHSKYDKKNFNFVAYNIPSVDQSYVRDVKNYVGYMYITNDDLPNPWDTLPSYLEELVASLDTGDVIPSQTNVVVPLYIYPQLWVSGNAWEQLADIAQRHPTSKIVAIINPNSGPGTSRNTDYATGIKMLKDAGITVVGYTYTQYGQRPSSEIRADIDRYQSLYSSEGGVTGILFDEMNNQPGKESYYKSLSDYAKSKGATLTIGNPGTSTIESYIGTVDTITIYEGEGLPSTGLLNDRTFAGKYDKSNFNYVAYGAPSLNTAATQSTAPYVGWLYVTNDNLPNPWDTLPSYLEELVSTIS